MRLTLVPLLLCLVTDCSHWRANDVSALSCPPADSLYSASPPGPGRDLHAVGPYPRFVTYVIDSVYVLRNRLLTNGADSTLSGLQTSDVATLELLKGVAGERWSGCRGVAAIMIGTRSRRWRPSDTLSVAHPP
jgi:hypothetical protein